jgi:hypothetical protein
MIQGKGNGKCVLRPLSLVLAGLVCSLLFLLAACGSRATTADTPSTPLTVTPSHPTPLTLKFACSDSPGGGFYVLAGDTHARVCVQTAPGAALKLTAKFCQGTPDPSSELKGTFHADSKGYYEWNWKPQTDCKALIWRGEADVTAQLNGQSTSLTTSFFRD